MTVDALRLVFNDAPLGEGASTIAVYIYAATHADREGVVVLPVKLVADLIGDSEKNVEVALARLCRPDAKARCNTSNGRRLVHLVANRYQLPLMPLYVEASRRESRRTYSREYQRKYRARKAREREAGSTA